MDWNKAAENLVRDLPSDIINIMSNLATVWGKECFLGGGAVRDLLLGKEIKDWDFYFPYEESCRAIDIRGIIQRVLTDDALVSVYISGSVEDELISTYSSYLVLDVKMTNVIPNRNLDLIFSGQKIDEFDHAICQCSINCATMELETTKWFDKCVEEKIHRIFTYNLPIPRVTHKSIHDHTKRIQKKYPWPIILETGIKYNYV